MATIGGWCLFRSRALDCAATIHGWPLFEEIGIYCTEDSDIVVQESTSCKKVIPGRKYVCMSCKNVQIPVKGVLLARKYKFLQESTNSYNKVELSATACKIVYSTC